MGDAHCGEPLLNVRVITLFPEMFEAVTQFGVVGRGVRHGRVCVETINPRDYTDDKHRTVDDRPYGGGPGMVMKVAPLKAAILAAKAELGEGAKVIYLSPQGRQWVQSVAESYVDSKLVLIAGRYEGIDERLIEQLVDEEWSVGDFVTSGGELPAMVLIDTMARLVPGVLGHAQSAVEDSFTNGLLDCPHYTRPEVLEGTPVPPVLLQGNHEEIRKWRMAQSLKRTRQRRPELFDQLQLSDEQRLLLDKIDSEQI